jgi:hypothetical protein
MVNDCIRIGLKFEEEKHATPSMKKLSLLCYSHLKRYELYSDYRLTAISKAAGILSSRRKSVKRGFSPEALTSLNRFSYHVTVSRFKMAS